MFGFLKRKKKEEPTEEQKKWNQMWDLWAADKMTSPCKEVMTYQSEVNNGGHDQYFLNVSNTGDLGQELSVLKTVLPPVLQQNLQAAYQAYLALEENDEDPQAMETMNRCDDVFWKNEGDILAFLKGYAADM